jgi:hypothetical protein
MAILITHFYAISQEEFHHDKKKEQRIDDLYLMSITALKYIQGMETHSFTLTWGRVTNMSLWETQRDM